MKGKEHVIKDYVTHESKRKSKGEAEGIFN